MHSSHMHFNRGHIHITRRTRGGLARTSKPASSYMLGNRVRPPKTDAKRHLEYAITNSTRLDSNSLRHVVHFHYCFNSCYGTGLVRDASQHSSGRSSVPPQHVRFPLGQGLTYPSLVPCTRNEIPNTTRLSLKTIVFLTTDINSHACACTKRTGIQNKVPRIPLFPLFQSLSLSPSLYLYHFLNPLSLSLR